MTHADLLSPPRRRHAHFSLAMLAALTLLSSWRVRRTAGMLLMVWIGMLAVVTLICSIPLYVHVTTTAGLRGIFSIDQDSPYITVHTSFFVSGSNVDVQSPEMAEALPNSDITPYLNKPPQLVLQQRIPIDTNSAFTVTAYSMQQAASHMHLVKGKLPDAHSSDLQVAITPSTADALNVQVGYQIVVPIGYTSDPLYSRNTIDQQKLSFTVVGLYTADVAHDPFWHEQENAPSITRIVSPPATKIYTFGIASLDTIESYYAKANTQHPGLFVSAPFDAFWYYHVNTTQIDVNQIGNFSAGLRHWKSAIQNIDTQQYGGGGGILLQQVNLSGELLGTSGSSSILASYQNRLDIVNIPTWILLLEISVLAMFFVMVMTSLLIERQSESIAILRSRGASGFQVFSLLTIQGFVLTLAALLVGPVLAWLAANQLVLHLVSQQQQDALNVINTDVMATITGLWFYALLASLAGLLAMVGSIVQALRRDVLSLRRQRARTNTRPLWQRLQLDLFAALVALIGYGISLYISSSATPDARTQLLVSSPLTLIAPIFLVIGGILLLLRLFPLLLHLGVTLAVRGRGAPALLAIGQMSRAPQQALRLTLLLALASAFAIFSLVFNASQDQRIQDIANYQAGADFSGFLRLSSGGDPKLIEQAVMETSGVRSVSAGFADSLTVANVKQTLSTEAELRAVDPGPFAQTALWDKHDSTQPLTDLMQQLINQRASAIQRGVVPAFVDATLWHALGLSVGSRFVITQSTATEGGNSVSFVALGEIERLPTTDQSVTTTFSPTNTNLPGAILVDFSTFRQVMNLHAAIPISLNFVWIHTATDAASISSARAAFLNNTAAVQIIRLNDRYGQLDRMQQDPLYLTLKGELLLGMLVALLLALLGSLLASWFSMRMRLTNFVILRALGSSLQQLAAMLSWEQSITYVSALLISIGFGALLIVTILPALIFSSVPIGGDFVSQSVFANEFYRIQSALPVQTIVPQTLLIFLAILVALCAFTLVMMTRAAFQPALAKALRINED